MRGGNEAIGLAVGREYGGGDEERERRREAACCEK